MVLDGVVRFSGDLLGNECPLVADLVVILYQHPFFFERPVNFCSVSVDVVFIPKF